MGVVSSWAKMPVPACLLRTFSKSLQKLRKKIYTHVAVLVCILLGGVLLDVQSSQLGGELVVISSLLLGALLLLLLQAEVCCRMYVSKLGAYVMRMLVDIPRPPSSAASPAPSPSSSFLGFFFFFFIRPRSRPSSAASGGGVSVSGAVAEAMLADARASESCSVDGLCDFWDVSKKGSDPYLRQEIQERGKDDSHHSGVFLFVRGGHDLDAAVFGDNNLLVVKRD